MSTIYLTNLARASAVRVGRSTRFAGEVGPGPVLGILRHPPAWARGLLAGHVVSLMPPATLLNKVRAGGIEFGVYREQLLVRWGAFGQYEPGRLTQGVRVGANDPEARGWNGAWWRSAGLVPDGATLCCVCERADACHRSVTAEILVSAK